MLAWRDGYVGLDRWSVKHASYGSQQDKERTGHLVVGFRLSAKLSMVLSESEISPETVNTENLMDRTRPAYKKLSGKLSFEVSG